MARIETDPNYSSPTFSRATAGTDLFKKEDVQALAAAVSTHTHATGKGAALEAGSIPTGSITSAMIADATIDTADLKDGAVTSAKIADGTIATADLTDQSVTNAKLASDTARGNLLTNGGLEVWQRGNGPVTTTGFYCSDRWELQIAGGDTLSVSRDTANTDGSSACAVCTYTRGTGGSNITNSGKELVAQLKGRTISLSVRVRTSVANAVRLLTYDGVGATFGAYHSGGGTYATLTVTHTVTSTATLLNSSVIFDQSCTAYIDNAMLVVGSVPADYAPLHPADDLARCLRYYESQLDPGYPALTGYAPAASSIFYSSMKYNPKCLTPTVTKVGTWYVENTGQPNLGTASRFGAYIHGTSTAAGQCLAIPNISGIGMVIEANP